MRIVLLGDSHLARIRRDLPALGDDVVNGAIGGSTVRDLAAQADAVALRLDDIVTVSVGTNDAAARHAPSPERFGAELDRFLRSHQVGRWVLVLPPGVVEDNPGCGGDRTNAVIDDHRAAVSTVASAVGAHIVDPRIVLAPLGVAGFADDGLHLNAAGYRALLPAVRAAVAGGRPALSDREQTVRD